jgi:hypothetical protein
VGSICQSLRPVTKGHPYSVLFKQLARENGMKTERDACLHCANLFTVQ